MKIGIDASMIDSNKAGIGYYAFSLIEALALIDLQNQYYIFTLNKDLLKEIKLPNNFKIIEIQGKGNLYWMFKCLPVIWNLNLDHFLSPSNLFWGCVLKKCTTVVHDIAQVLHPEFFYKKGNLFYRIELNVLLRRKGLVITPSNSVKQEILKNFKFIRSDIEVIAEGLHSWVLKEYHNGYKEEVIKRYNLPNKYVLTVGTLEPRKNLVKVILGFKEYLRSYNSNIKLLIVDKKGWFYEEIFKIVKEHNLDKDVMFLGYVPDSDLPVIYDLSDFIVSLSYYEGFGLPLIEANARKKSVLASDISVYRELSVNGLYISPDADNLEISKAMDSIKSIEFTLPQDFFDRYSWKKTAKDILELWLKR